MNKLWSLFKFGFLSSVLAVVISSCGQTGAETIKTNNVSADNPNATLSSAAATSSLAVSSANSSLGNFAATMEDTTIFEGTPELDGNIILPDGVDPIMPLK